MSFYFESVLEDACRCGEFIEFWLEEEEESARAEILGFAAIYSKKNPFQLFFDEQVISAAILAQALHITCCYGKRSSTRIVRLAQNRRLLVGHGAYLLSRNSRTMFERAYSYRSISDRHLKMLYEISDLAELSRCENLMGSVMKRSDA
ncbi:hypothetical protein [Stenotrophomonas maltophilia]|uniref:hypothetical protein n=1 Tax=Stenotrophomonas maltophilia TaxID=40324 RepID=UPI0013773002|nr:hypothetical protein [Stenotrophomonas maltophilia]